MFRRSTSMASSSGPSDRRGSITSACCGSTPLGRTTRRSPYGSLTRHTDGKALRRNLLLVGGALRELDERREQVDGHGEDGGAGLLRADLHQGLQIAELQRGRVRLDDVRRHAQL